MKTPFTALVIDEIEMATCVKCGKPIGLLEYTLGDSKKVGLCKTCRLTEKWCDDCVFMLKISMEDSSVFRCIKYGYDLSKRKDWTKANNCQDFTPKIMASSQKPKKDTKSKASSRINKASSPKTRKGKPNGWF